MLVPEGWKSSNKVQPWHIAQLGIYSILVEEAYGVRPLHGVIVLGDGVRKRIENTEELRKQALDVARRIRDARRRFGSKDPDLAQGLAVPRLRPAESLSAGPMKR